MHSAIFIKFTDRNFFNYIVTQFFIGSDKKAYISIDGSSSQSKNKTFTQETIRLLFCSAGLLLSYLIWGLLQEKIMTQVRFLKTHLLLSFCGK